MLYPTNGAQVLVELVRSSQPMSALARQFTPAPQKLENVRFAAGVKPRILRPVSRTKRSMISAGKPSG